MPDVLMQPAHAEVIGRQHLHINGACNCERCPNDFMPHVHASGRELRAHEAYCMMDKRHDRERGLRVQPKHSPVHVALRGRSGRSSSTHERASC